MLFLAQICIALLPLAYSATVGVYALAFFRKDESYMRFTRPALITALAIHTILIYAETAHYGHCLVYSPFELMTLISYMIALTYLIVELTTKERGTGLFFIGLALLFQTVSHMFGSNPGEINVSPVLLNTTVGLHITAAIFGYTAFSMSAVYGGLYLMLHHQIKSSRFGAIYTRLPSLGLLEVMSEKTAMVGVAFLSVAIGIALAYLPDILPTFSYTDPKLIATAVIWLVYVIALASKYVIRLEGRKVMILSLVGFVGTLLSMTVINLFLSGFHGFR